MELINLISDLSEKEFLTGVLVVLSHESEYGVLEETDEGKS